ncbi:DUF6002 family protein [Streptomyces sp. 12297]
MSETGRAAVTGQVVHNALDRYFEEIRTAARKVTAERTTAADIPLELAAKNPSFAKFTEVTDIGLTQVDARTHILDLMRNPGARTTKTMASLLMIARAADHIRRTGERVLLFTPTSGNKGTALRDAVARAHATGLATPDELRIVMLAPEASRTKLRDCALTADQALRTANPVTLARVEQPADVKLLSSEVVRRHATEILDTTGFRVWYTLDLDNYRIADAARAFAEAELLPITADSAPRVHVHSVSSAFGLLGYHLGHRLLTEGLPGHAVPARHPGFHLVQQLATADMVTSLLGTKVPDYTYDEAAGVWRQDSMAEFPAVTDDPEEVIDPTFYTKEPATRTQLNEIVARHGGGGIVVSRRECLEHFAHVRELAAAAGIEIAADPSLIREWSLVKALTGVLISRERGLLAPDTDVVVHGSGYYSDALLPALREEHLTRVATVDDLARAVLAAAHA